MEPNGIPFASKTKEKLLVWSHSIQFEQNLKHIVISLYTHRKNEFSFLSKWMVCEFLIIIFFCSETKRHSRKEHFEGKQNFILWVYRREYILMSRLIKKLMRQRQAVRSTGFKLWHHGDPVKGPNKKKRTSRHCCA